MVGKGGIGGERIYLPAVRPSLLWSNLYWLNHKPELSWDLTGETILVTPGREVDGEKLEHPST